MQPPVQEDSTPSRAVGSGTDPDRSGEPPEHAAAARPGDALLARSLALVRFLREHCPWDAAQTAETLRPYLLEESHETAEAILAGDDEELRGELGDLLLNVAFQIVVAEERDAFDAAGVVHELEAKMRRRHPHVYGDADEAPDWERVKAAERAEDGEGSVGSDPATAGGSDASVQAEEATPERAGREQGADPFAGLPAGLEPLSRAVRIQQRAAGVGFDWPAVEGALAKLEEEIAELREQLPPEPKRTHGGGWTHPDEEAVAEEIGDLLFAAVNVARLAGAHASTALHDANRKFERRFRRLVLLARERGLDLETASLEEMEAVWRKVKGEE